MAETQARRVRHLVRLGSLAWLSRHQSTSRNAKLSNGAKKYLRDGQIPHRTVQLVDQTSGRLTPPTTMAEVLASINRKTHFVELVSTEPTPIVKIIDKKEAFEKRKQQKAKAKEVSKKNTQKEVQLTWGAAAGDLSHKIKRVRQELEKGSKVDLVFAPKKGQPLPTPPEMRQRVDEVVEMLSDVAKEWKEKEFQKTAAAIFLQGLSQSDSVVNPLPTVEKS
ncbi:hypothetical protein BD779DRAFT_1663157 [Infundibulicybe gibba]|nr:hypothetical protein BD779DRAFT_1663157 [Infundibulicybe gibba]